MPRSHDLTLMHGDYKLDNVVFSNDVPPTILSVLDFEMTTIGDPLIDLAWAMIFWPEEGNTLAFVPPGQPGDMDHNYCQTPLQLVPRYSDRSSRDLSNLDWYNAFSAWKLAIVLEASYTKHLSGRSKNPLHTHFGTVVDQLLIRARRFRIVRTKRVPRPLQRGLITAKANQHSGGFMDLYDVMRTTFAVREFTDDPLPYHLVSACGPPPDTSRYYKAVAPQRLSCLPYCSPRWLFRSTRDAPKSAS